MMNKKNNMMMMDDSQEVFNLGLFRALIRGVFCPNLFVCVYVCAFFEKNK